jgi:hypothetical protein
MCVITYADALECAIALEMRADPAVFHIGTLRPVVNWRCVTFTFVAFDQIVNQAAKLRYYMSGGQADFPIVFRTFYIGGMRSAAQHSQTGYSMFAHAAGLKIVAPATPAIRVSPTCSTLPPRCSALRRDRRRSATSRTPRRSFLRSAARRPSSAGRATRARPT